MQYKGLQQLGDELKEGKSVGESVPPTEQLFHNPPTKECVEQCQALYISGDHCPPHRTGFAMRTTQAF